MTFQDNETTKKGNIGEEIADQWLVSKGYMPYRPAQEVDRPHPFDRLTASFDKKTLRIVEVKSKAKRQKYPDTGINVRHFNDYIFVESKYDIEVFILFIDEEKGEIYGNFINKLAQEAQVTHNGKILNYPIRQKYQGTEIIYFPIENMLRIKKLTADQITELKKHTTKNAKYT